MKVHQQLAQLLQREIGLLDALMNSIASEYSSLSDNQLDQLSAAVERKQRLVTELEQVSLQRKSTMDSLLGTDTGQCDVTPMLARDAELSRLWSELTTRAAQCREQNRKNGSIVEAVSRQIGQAIDLLHGKQLPDSTTQELYNQAGHPVGGTVKHTLTQV